MTPLIPQPVEKATDKKPRALGKRRQNYAETSRLLRKLIPEEYALRGADSDELIARDCNVQRITVLSMVVHDLVKQMRSVQATLVMRGAASEPRKPIRGEGAWLEVVPRKGAA